MVRTELPYNDNGEFKTTPGYAVLFSQHPAFLARLFLWKDEEGVEPPTAEEIQAKVTVIAARYEHDILQTNPKTGAKHIVTAWAKTACDRHTNTFSQALKRHGSIIRDGENVLRSGSSILWKRPSKIDPEKYDCFYYSNPIFGQVSLYMDQGVLEETLSGKFFSAAALKLNDEPLHKNDADLFMHKEYTKFARGIMRNQDPFDECHFNEGLIHKVKRLSHKAAIRTTQKVVHSVANIDWKALAFTAGLSGFLVFAMQLPGMFFAASMGKSNFLMKGAQSVTRAASKFLSPIKTVSVNALNDVSALLAAHVKNNIVTDEVRGLIANPHYIANMHAVPMDFMSNTYPDLVDYSDKHEEEWAKSVILDTLGIQPGTIYSEVEINGQGFLKAEQPNGLDVYYDPEEHVAFAHKIREPFEHTTLEKPIQKLFDKMPDHHEFIGIRLSSRGNPVKTTFKSLDNIPKAFQQSRAKSIQELEQGGLDINNLGPKPELPILKVLPPSVAKKEQKRADKALKKCLEYALHDTKCLEIFNGSSLQDRIDEYLHQTHSKKPGEGTTTITIEQSETPLQVSDEAQIIVCYASSEVHFNS